MSRPIPKDELDNILHHLSLFIQSVSLKEINQVLQPSLPKHTLQRRLAFLVEKGIVNIEGKARARRYRLASAITNKIKAESILEEKQNYLIPLSLEAKAIQLKVQQPIQARTHVSYNRKFLDEYRPNVTSYLPETLRQRLHELGKTDGERPAGTYAREIFNRLLIDLAWNSSRLEGNTYSLLETGRLLELSEAADGKDLTETQMILNHKEAIEFLVNSAEDVGINRYTVLNLHALLSHNLLADSGACGRIRERPVGIHKTVYHPLAVPALIKECFQQILDTAHAIKDPYEQSFFLMVHLPYLQPFEDVNKRVSRLAANIPLIRLNLCPLSFVDVPQNNYVNGLLAVYELNRIELLRDVFIWAYERSCALYSATRTSLGEPDPFRMRYRALIFETITMVVRELMDIQMAVNAIKLKASEKVISEDQSKFIETVETELKGLHEGNIARYRLRPSEYEAWQKIWK